MNHDPKRIIIHRILSNNTHDSGTNTTGRTPIFSANHWITYALLIPVVILFCRIPSFDCRGCHLHRHTILVVT